MPGFKLKLGAMKNFGQAKFYLALMMLIGLWCRLSANPPGVVPTDHYNFLTSVGEPGTGRNQLMHPQGLAFSPDGRLLAVTDTDNNRVCLYYVDDRPTATQPLLLKAIYSGLWPWDDRHHFKDSADKYRERDFLEGRNPNYLAGRAYQNGQAEIRPGEAVPMDHFNLPESLTWLGTDTLLIADTGNHRIKAMKLNGKVIWILGQEGWKDGYFHHPLGIDADCEGNLYVAEPRSNYLRDIGLDLLQRQRAQGNRMQKFSPQLKPAGRLGHMHHMSGRDYRQFKNLTRVWVSTGGDIYLADNGNHRIMVFDQALQKKAEIGKWPLYRLRHPNGIDGALDGRIVIADTGNHRVLILSPDYKIRQIVGKFGTLPGHLAKPAEARFGPNGDLYILNSGNCRIDIFRNTETSRQFPRCPRPEPPPPEPVKEEPKLEELLPPPGDQPAGQDSF
ncbi:MAG: NHL repeat-containing protein [Candidatus Riflebacteria bacterium]